MIIVIAEVVTRPGMEQAYEDSFRALQAIVSRNEPQCVLYQSGRSREESSTYRAVEVFADQEALDFHLESAWLRDGWSQMQASIASVEVSTHESV